MAHATTPKSKLRSPLSHPEINQLYLESGSPSKRGELLASPSAQEGAGPVGSDTSEWVVSEKKNQRVDFPGLSDERLRRGTDLLACAPLTCVMHKVTD